MRRKLRLMDLVLVCRRYLLDKFRQKIFFSSIPKENGKKALFSVFLKIYIGKPPYIAINQKFD